MSQQGIQECRELCGGLGYSVFNRIGSQKHDDDINATWEGDINVLVQQTVKFMFDTLRKIKSDKMKQKYTYLDFLTKEFDFDQYLKSTNSKSAFASSNYDIIKAFQIKSNYLTHLAFQQMGKELQEADTPFDAWNNVQIEYAQEAARAYCDVFVLRALQDRINGCKHDDSREVLLKLKDLLAYFLVENDYALRDLGYIKREDSLYIKEKIKNLLKELKDQLIGLIDAIAVPDHVLNSAIGASDGDIYERFISAMKNAPGALDRPFYWKEILE